MRHLSTEGNHSPFEIGCDHVFCEECVEPWFEKDNTTCPLCRAVVVEKEEGRVKEFVRWGDALPTGCILSSRA